MTVEKEWHFMEGIEANQSAPKTYVHPSYMRRVRFESPVGNALAHEVRMTDCETGAPIVNIKSVTLHIVMGEASTATIRYIMFDEHGRSLREEREMTLHDPIVDVTALCDPLLNLSKSEPELRMVCSRCQQPIEASQRVEVHGIPNTVQHPICFC